MTTDPTSLAVTGTVDYSGYYDLAAAFVPQQGYSYAISGWAKGKGVPANAIGAFGIAFLSNPSGSPILGRNNAYLESALAGYLAFGERENVPMNVGEFGLNKDCFADNRGGLA